MSEDPSLQVTEVSVVSMLPVQLSPPTETVRVGIKLLTAEKSNSYAPPLLNCMSNSSPTALATKLVAVVLKIGMGRTSTVIDPVYFAPVELDAESVYVWTPVEL